MTNPYRAPYVLPPSIQPGPQDHILSLVNEETNWKENDGNGGIAPRSWFTIVDQPTALFGNPSFNPIDLEFEQPQINDLGVTTQRDLGAYTYTLPDEVGKYRVSMELSSFIINNTGRGAFRFIDHPSGNVIAASSFESLSSSTSAYTFSVLLDESQTFRVQLEVFSDSASIESGFAASLYFEKIQ